eukprot:5803107-Ditylum_brightwellii.AAC.1
MNALETTLLEKFKDHTPPPKSRKDKEFENLFNELRKESKVVVNQQLSKTAQEVPRSYVTGLHEDAKEFLKQIDFLLSEKENEFIKETIFLKVIPQPQLLVKDHKDLDENSNFPTRLVIPATSFTTAFSKLGYMGIKKVLDNHNVNCAKHTIVQSSDLKERTEKCGLQQNKALNDYAKNLPPTARETID